MAAGHSIPNRSRRGISVDGECRDDVVHFHAVHDDNDFLDLFIVDIDIKHSVLGNDRRFGILFDHLGRLGSALSNHDNSDNFECHDICIVGHRHFAGV